jgi:hypothetical protein
MKITKKLEKRPRKQNLYELEIETMEGDADDTHTVQFNFKESEEDELKKYIVACGVLNNSYPSGRSGGDKYTGPYWDLLNDGWYHDNMGFEDSYDGYCLYYYDKNGLKYNCTVEYDEEMLKEIKDNTAEM